MSVSLTTIEQADVSLRFTMWYIMIIDQELSAET